MMEHNGDSHLVLEDHTVLEDVCRLYLYYFRMDTSESRKRGGPETRTIVMAPEKKKARYEYAEDEGPTEQELLLNSLWWMTKRPLKIDYPSDEIWFDNRSLIMQYNRTPPKSTFHTKLNTSEALHLPHPWGD